jgi:hypothetical protein
MGIDQVWIDDDEGPPVAHTIFPHVCTTRPITHIHLMLVDEEGMAIAQATVNQSMLTKWQRLLDGTDPPNDEESKEFGIEVVKDQPH